MGYCTTYELHMNTDDKKIWEYINQNQDDEYSYLVYDNFKIGYIKSLCTCQKCKERGMAEVFINDLEGKYQDCIKANEIENIIYFGNSLNEAFETIIYQIKTKELENKYLQSLIDFYSKELVGHNWGIKN